TVVHHASDQRPVGIALQECHHNLMSDTRYPLVSPAVAGPGLGHAHKTRAVARAFPKGILFALILFAPVPVEANLYASKLVGANLLVPGLIFGTDNDRLVGAGTDNDGGLS